LHQVEAEIAALVGCWQGRTIAVMLRHTKAGITRVRMRCARFRKACRPFPSRSPGTPRAPHPRRGALNRVLQLGARSRPLRPPPRCLRGLLLRLALSVATMGQLLASSTSFASCRSCSWLRTPEERMRPWGHQTPTTGNRLFASRIGASLTLSSEVRSTFAAAQRFTSTPI
jgi:hypothetical protein